MSKTAGITNDLAQKSGDPPGGVPGGSPDDFRRDNIAGPHGIVWKTQKKNLPSCHSLLNIFEETAVQFIDRVEMREK